MNLMPEANLVCVGPSKRTQPMPYSSDARERVESPIFTKAEAAQYCRISMRTFERMVQRHLPTIPIGSRIFYHKEDLDKWLEQQKAGSSAKTPARTCTKSGSPMRVGVAPSQRANAILARLQAKQDASTARLSQVDGAQAKSL
jgi:excisionase family DNA binding protein